MVILKPYITGKYSEKRKKQPTENQKNLKPKYKLSLSGGPIFTFRGTNGRFAPLAIALAKGGIHPKKFLAYLVILCVERRCPKQNSVARLKSKTLSPQKHFGWLRHCHWPPVTYATAFHTV